MAWEIVKKGTPAKMTKAAVEFWNQWRNPPYGHGPTKAKEDRIRKRAQEIASERGANRIGRNHLLAAIAGK